MSGESASNAVDEQIVGCIYEAIEEVNLGRGPDEALATEMETELLSEAGGLDSLGMVNFIVALEDQLQSAVGRTVPLADTAMDPALQHHFATVEILALHLSQVLADGT